MSAPDPKVTEILTEHLEFPPMLLLDQIINAVNNVMYKCTESIEEYLSNQLPRSQSQSHDDVKKGESTEIELGTAKLEMLLESTIDKNFDKFELYCLRNILMVPNELNNKGYFKLKHHDGIVFDKENVTKSTTCDLRIKEAYTEIKIQLYIKKTLLGQLALVKRLLKLLHLYKDSLDFLNQNSTTSNESINAVLKTLSPLKESLYYLLQQNIEFFGKIDSIKQLLSTTSDTTETTEKDITYVQREVYLKTESIKLMKFLGLVKEKGKVEQFYTNLNDVDIQNVDLRNKLVFSG